MDLVPYAQSHPEHTVVGDLRLSPAFYSPELEHRRDLLVLLPAGYEATDRRYPVLYMHDGQNLFDRRTSFAGEWEVDETMAALRPEGLEAIVVGIPHRGEDRLREYCPYPDRRFGNVWGAKYVEFIVRSLKPTIDASLRTLPGRDHTGILGSSLGGMISLYAFVHWPQVFGLAGALSPALWFGRGKLYKEAEQLSTPSGKVYLDVGGREAAADRFDRLLFGLRSRAYVASVRRMVRALRRRGYRQGTNLLYVEEREGVHHETAWSRRLPEALRFLLSP